MLKCKVLYLLYNVLLFYYGIPFTIQYSTTQYNTIHFSILICNKTLQVYVKKGPDDGVFKPKQVARLDK